MALNFFREFIFANRRVFVFCRNLFFAVVKDWLFLSDIIFLRFSGSRA